MARSTSTWITQSLTNLLPRRRIVRLARQLGVVRRRRKLNIVALVHCLVLGFSAGERRTLTGLRRAYTRATGIRLAPSSFHARFSEELTSLMRTLSLEALQRQARSRPRLKAVFAPFVEVLAVDSSWLRLHHALEPFYPSVWTHHTKASAKLGMVLNVIGRGAKTVAITHGSRHDVHLLKAGPWVKGRLLIFDLGFYRATLFDEIRQHGGYFLVGQPVQELQDNDLSLVGCEMLQGSAHLGCRYAAFGSSHRIIIGIYQCLVQGKMPTMLLAPVVIHHDVVGYPVKPGPNIVTRAFAFVHSLEKTLEYLGR